MRRKIIIAVVAAIYIVVAAVGIYLIYQKDRHQTTAPTCVSSIAGPADTGDTLVFVSRNGLWYHRPGCRELEKSGIPAKLSVASKYCRPCTRCRPQR
jgi:hypothetical protein